MPNCNFQAVSAAAMDPQLKHLNLREYLFSTEEEGLIENILAVLKPLKTATVFISAQKQPTASKILPTLAKLRMEMTVNEETDSALTTQMKVNILENLNKRYTDESASSFLLKATYLDPRYKSLHNIAKGGAMAFVKQGIKDMCAKVVDHKAASNRNTFPSLPAAVPIKEEPQDTQPVEARCQEPEMKKVKLEAENYDDWLDDVIYVKTDREKVQVSDFELINQELEKYDAEPQARGDPLLWWKNRQGSMPILAEVSRAILCVPG